MDARNYYDNAAYVYNGTDGLLVVGLYGEGALVDLSDTPIVLANPTMEVEGEVTSIIPAGKIDENAITITSTLVAVETVSVTAGNFENALKFRYDIFDSPSSTYTEIVWFAKGVGPVRTYRQSENPPNHEGCLWTCGSFDEDFDVVEERDLQLRSYVKTRRCGPVIFLGD